MLPLGDVLLTIGAATDRVLSSAPVWGPTVAGPVVVVAWWRLRPTGRHRRRRTPVRGQVRGGVRGGVLAVADTVPLPVVVMPVTCADTCPDVSADMSPAVSADTCPAMPGPLDQDTAEDMSADMSPDVSADCPAVSGHLENGARMPRPGRYWPDTRQTGLPRPAHWDRRASCRHEDPQLFFPEGDAAHVLGRTAEAKGVCRECPVVDRCLSDALERGEAWGVWGGLDADERAALLGRRREGRADDASPPTSAAA